MSSSSGMTTTISTATKAKPMSSRLRLFLSAADMGHLLTLRTNRPCGRSISSPITMSSVSTLAIDPDMKNSRVDCDCEMVKRRRDGAEQALGAAEHDDEERVDDVELAGGRAGRSDHREGRAGDAGDAAAEAEGQLVDAPRVDADGIAHGAVCDHGADLQAPARAVHQQRHHRRNHEGQSHHEQAVDLHLDGFRDIERTHHPCPAARPRPRALRRSSGTPAA